MSYLNVNDIVEHEQKGAVRAEYGTELIKILSARLTEEFGKGFSAVNLAQMRRFFLSWKDRVAIFQTPSEKLVPTGFGKGFSKDNHYNMRRFYLSRQERVA